MGPETAVSGRLSIPDFLSLLTGRLPGQRRTTREADLSTQQTGAQAPSRLPRPPRHDRRPQGPRRAPCAWPQAPERLRPGLSGDLHHGSAKAAGGLPRRCQWRAGQAAPPSSCKAAAATIEARSGSASPSPRRTAPPPSATGSAAGFAKLVKRLDVISMRPHHDYVLVGRRAALDRDFDTMLDDLRSALHRLDRQGRKRTRATQPQTTD